MFVVDCVVSRTVILLVTYDIMPHVLSWYTQIHSCQPNLGVNLSPEFVNLYLPYAGQGFCFVLFLLVAVTF